jgi:hypothetical protein
MFSPLNNCLYIIDYDFIDINTQISFTSIDKGIKVRLIKASKKYKINKIQIVLLVKGTKITYKIKARGRLSSLCIKWMEKISIELLQRTQNLITNCNNSSHNLPRQVLHFLLSPTANFYSHTFLFLVSLQEV